MTQETLAPTCTGCGAARSEHWLFISGQTAPGHPRGADVPARALLCGTCQIERAAELADFVDGLAPGWTSVADDGGRVTHIR